MAHECDHERIRTGTMKELKDALRKHKPTAYVPWLEHKRACEGDRRRESARDCEGREHSAEYDTEEER